MLVLSRRADEAIVIGDDIVVTILDVSANQVRIGIDAPSRLSIDRHEVRERKLEEAVAEMVDPFSVVEERE